MAHEDIISGIVQELRRGTYILLVLHKLRTPMYGYSLVRILQDNSIPIEANTLYPLLRRLESQGLLKSEWETDETKPRKYYVTTEAGLEVLKKIRTHWEGFSADVNKLLCEN